MTYRGHVHGGVIILDGAKLAEGTRVEVIAAEVTESVTGKHPAIGIWKDRVDLPADSVEASKVLRAKLLRREDAGSQ